MKSHQMTRREVSFAMAGAAGTCLLPQSLCAGEKSPLADWRVGRSVGGVRPIDQLKLTEVKAAGFSCIEISISDASTAKMDDGEWLAWFKELKNAADAAGIEVRSVHIPFGKTWDISDPDETVRKTAVQKCGRYFELIELLGAKIFVLHPSYEPIKDDIRPRRIESCIESLKELAPKAADRDAVIALENLPRTCLGNTSGEINRILDAVDVPEGLQICFDSNHPLKEKPEEFVAACGKRIVTTHMSDYDAVDEKHWLPYEGVIDWKAVMTELVKAGYPGPFIFETAKFKDRPAGDGEIFETWLRIKKEFENG